MSTRINKIILCLCMVVLVCGCTTYGSFEVEYKQNIEFVTVIDDTTAVLKVDYTRYGESKCRETYLLGIEHCLAPENEFLGRRYLTVDVREQKIYNAEDSLSVIDDQNDTIDKWEPDESNEWLYNSCSEFRWVKEKEMYICLALSEDRMNYGIIDQTGDTLSWNSLGDSLKVGYFKFYGSGYVGVGAREEYGIHKVLNYEIQENPVFYITDYNKFKTNGDDFSYNIVDYSDSIVRY